MEITISQEQGRVPVTVFHIDGRINLGNANELQAKGEEVYRHGTRNLIINLTEVESITSAGLRAILTIHKLLSGGTDQTPKSKHLKLVNPTPQVLRVLKTSGFASFLEIFENLPDAVGSF
jgi:anti-anti-sigma factor